MYIWAATAALCSSGIIRSAEKKKKKTCKIKVTFNQKTKIYKVDHLKTHPDFPPSSPKGKTSCQFVKSGNKIKMFHVRANCQFSASSQKKMKILFISGRISKVRAGPVMLCQQM